MNKGIISYYCGRGQKKKTAERTKKYKASNPIIGKLDAFNQTYKKKGIDNKITHFQRKNNKSGLTIKRIIEKFGATTTCYLTGDNIDLSEPTTYSFDHKTPVSKGGDNSIENLGICTQDVNMSKSDKTPSEFIALCKKVLIYNGYYVAGPV